MNGKRDDGTPLRGTYIDLDGHEKRLSWSNGFEENVEYFRLDFVDPEDVARGEAFKSILPILWLMADARGARAETKGSTPWFIAKKAPFAVLIKEKEFKAFREKLRERPDTEWAFLVTDSEESFASMRRSLGKRYYCVQLFKSYLENFRINLPDALSDGGAR